MQNIKKECPECGGTGLSPCPFCDGTGNSWHQPHYYIRKCEGCDGKGMLKCDTCAKREEKELRQALKQLIYF